MKEPGGDLDPGWMREWGRRAALGVDLDKERSSSRLLLWLHTAPPPAPPVPSTPNPYSTSAAAPGRHVRLAGEREAGGG